ncbi:MAG: DUF4861 domain-containing protein [bacterium]
MELGSKLGAMTLILLIVILGGCSKSPEGKRDLAKQYPEALQMTVKNAVNLARKDALVAMGIEEIKTNFPQFNPAAFVVLDAGKELASQADDLDGDGALDQITFVADFTTNESKAVTVRYATSGEKKRDYLRRTQAELSHKFGGKWMERKYEGGQFQNVDLLRVPPEHTDHSLFFRYEGPGWESDKVGYRFYLDWRNAIDIFGKKTSQMVLQDVGQDGFDSYHEMADWGMDILKVGESLGIGSIGMWHHGKVYRVSETDGSTCRISANGPVFSSIQTRYFGWKVGSKKFDLTSNLSITAGSRLTRHEVVISGEADNLCTGLVKHKDTEVLQSAEAGSDWAYFANFGKQSLAGDNLGMAILYRRSELIQMTEDELSHVLVLKPQNGKLTYYFLAAWEQEPDGLRTQVEFQEFLDKTVTALNMPVAIKNY